MLRVMHAVVPAARALGRTFLLSYRSKFDPALVRVWQMAVGLLCASHWCGCLWWLIGLKQQELPHDPAVSPWGPSPWLLEQEFALQYFHAFLWGVGMLTTQMPYDVLPSTALEVGVTACTILVALVIANLTTSSITSMLSSMDNRDAVYRAQMGTLTRYEGQSDPPANY